MKSEDVLNVGLIFCARDVSVVQVAELTKIIEENELFKYPQQDDFIGTVGCSP